MSSTGTGVAGRLDAMHREVYERMPERILDPGDVAASVAALRASADLRERAPLPGDVAIEDRAAPGLGGAPDVPVRLYRPRGLAAGAPALYWIHGGGMVLGSVPMSDGFCGQQAADLGILVASVEYRLAPEHPYPAPLEDCYAGLRWFASSARELGADPARIAIGGGSAGGGLATSVPWPMPRTTRSSATRRAPVSISRRARSDFPLPEGPRSRTPPQPVATQVAWMVSTVREPPPAGGP